MEMLGREGCSLFDWSDCHWENTAASITGAMGTGATAGGWLGGIITGAVSAVTNLVTAIKGGPSSPTAAPAAPNYLPVIAIGLGAYLLLKKR